MEHYKSGQYDDDLTVGIDDYDEDFDAGDIDLFDYVGDEDSPLSRLKSIILSIDWEITDDILRQFNEELRDLKGLWADEKINLIYVQALEKISRYIYKEKSSAHPNAIKLLLTFYTNLEKIVSDDTLTEIEIKKILKEDIDRFEILKRQISPGAAQEESVSPAPEEVEAEEEKISHSAPAPTEVVAEESPVEGDPLLNLKALVYGIDWEITEQDLKKLSSEVKQLEDKFKSQKAKLIFLQGIGSLGAYINLKRSNAHADAFKLLHSFFAGLENVVKNNLSGQAEKDILLPQVEKFNTFKATIAETISPDAAGLEEDDQDLAMEEYGDGEIQPAFSDVPEDVKGFQEEPAAVAGDPDDADEYLDDDVDVPPSKEDQALASEMESRLEGMFEEPGEDAAFGLDPNVALQGVDVETEADDESDEEPLPLEDGELAPALAEEEPLPETEEAPAVFADKIDDVLEEPETSEEMIIGDSVQGVDVEHEADDDADEEPLPMEDGEFAPALAGDEPPEEEEQDQVAGQSDIDGRLDAFFGEEESDEDSTEPADATDDDLIAEAEQPVDSGELIEEDEPPMSVTEEVDDVVTESDDLFADADAAEEVEEALAFDSVEDDEVEEVEEALAFDAEEAEETKEIFSADADEVEETEEPLAFDDEETEESLEAVADEADEVVADADTDTEKGLEQEVAETDTVEVEDTLEADDEADDEVDEAFEGEVEEFFATDAELSPKDSGDIALQGVDVETEDDDDSDEEPLPMEHGELAPAFAGTDEITEDEDVEVALTENIAEEEPVVEDETLEALDDEQPAEAVVEDEFDKLFGDDEDEPTTAEIEDESGLVTADSQGAEIEETEEDVEDFFATDTAVAEDGTPAFADDTEEPSLFDEPDETDESKSIFDEFDDQDDEVSALEGVAVETPDDDDSDETPLPFEDGELAPALSEEESALFDSEVAQETTAEAEVADKFDDVFGQDEEITFDDGAEDELLQALEGADETSEGAFAETTLDDETEDELIQALEGADEIRDETLAEAAEELDEVESLASFEDSGFDEIFDEEIDEIPDEAFSETAAGDTSEELGTTAEEEEILAMLSDGEEFDEIPEQEEELDSAFADLDKEAELTSESEDLIDELMGDSPTTPEYSDAFAEVAPAFEGTEEEEEVVFEAVDEDELLEDEDKLAFDEVDDVDVADSFGTTLLSEDSEPEEESFTEALADEAPVAFMDEDTPEEEDETLGVAVDPDDEEMAPYLSDMAAATPDNLAELKNCIASLGLEINETILGSLNEEIEKLRLTYLDKPAEKTMIQLLSTISGHIETYKYEADAEANNLLLSVFDKLEQCTLEETDPAEVQEAILVETSKVLEWQSKLIERTPDAPAAAFMDDTDSALAPPADASAVETVAEVSQEKVDPSEDTQLIDNVSAIMKTEIEQLIQAFQSEIQDLKDEIRKIKDKDD